MKETTHQHITNTLRDRILSGALQPGDPFPTNLEIMTEFNAHDVTVQSAVYRLIQEGLVISEARKRRHVAPRVQSSRRFGGFINEGSSHTQSIEALEIVTDLDRLPEGIGTPAIRYVTRQCRARVVVAHSESYIPSAPFGDRLADLQAMLADPRTELYAAMRGLGVHPVSCSECLRADFPTPDETRVLGLAPPTMQPIVRITRTVFDRDGHLVEFCRLTDRADAYEFCYQFPLSPAHADYCWEPSDESVSSSPPIS